MIGTEVHPKQVGVISWINGPVVRARGSRDVGMHEVLQVGPEHLIGEVIRLSGDTITLQVYEETAGLKPGMPLYTTGSPLSLELGPGLMSGIFDGIQRPLPVIEMRNGPFIPRGIQLTPLYRKQAWGFVPRVEVGQLVHGGVILGAAQETPLVEHRVMLPHGISGELTWIAPEGEYTLEDEIARVATLRGERSVTMLQRWPVRKPRPSRMRLRPSELLVTGQRVLDTFFPLAKGGTAAIPGGFGAGKTVLQHQIAKWSDADVIIYVGCGERGNEMADVLRQFPELRDSHSGRPLMERTILIANTSNMPVAAREASIYTGVTLAEYYRDMGYDVALMADSTSRWAEALREISGRLEEMPADEGFPAYLPARLAEFYERAGSVTTLNGDRGSVSLIGAVSPPGGDFSEPVTQHTRRFVRCFWALDKALAAERHFPSVNWLESYSQYADEVGDWWEAQGYGTWATLRGQALDLLQRESHLQQIVQLIGADALPDDQRLILETARLLRQGFLQQNAMDDVDTFASIDKQIRLLSLILDFHGQATGLIGRGCPVIVIRDLPSVGKIVRLKDTVANDAVEQIDVVRDQLRDEIRELEQRYI
ncbi:MAG: V-type ATP synthase subunit A [Anaerolineae bacterium]|nr:V-type ATP synthase subunit A [Anaerolineae bacterium]